ncbi:MAG: DUF427 domain-containing protein, partial [Bacteroidota bacterium]
MIKRISPKPGQESVWDYPRPPRLEPVSKSIQVFVADELIVDTQGAFRVLETSHPPTYYLPPADIKMEYFERVLAGGSFCEWKGRAHYYTLTVSDKIAERVAWYYPTPTERFRPMTNYV